MTWMRWIEFGGTPLRLFGPSDRQQQAEGTQQQVSQEQLQISQASERRQEEQYAQSQKLEKPLIDRETAIAGGDRNAALSAAMPVIGNITKGFEASKAAIMNQIPPGAARDKALADLNRQQFTGVGGAVASEVEKAPQILAQIGSGDAALSIQELAGALSGAQGAASTSGAIAQEENASQANKLQFFGGLAGAAGTAAASFKSASGGGGEQVNWLPGTTSFDTTSQQFTYMGFP